MNQHQCCISLLFIPPKDGELCQAEQLQAEAICMPLSRRGFAAPKPITPPATPKWIPTYEFIGLHCTIRVRHHA
jgi:hypothetical protein